MGPLPLYDSLQNLHRQRFNVNPVRNALVGHDGGGIGVDQNGGDTLFPQGLAGLGARVIELRRLADDDGPGPDYQDLVRLLGDLTPPRGAQGVS